MPMITERVACTVDVHGDLWLELSGKNYNGHDMYWYTGIIAKNAARELRDHLTRYLDAASTAKADE